MDVAEIEVRLEALGVEPDRALVERLGLDQLVARVVDVREVDDRGHQVRIDHERLAIRRGGFRHPMIVPIVEPRGFHEVLGGEGGLRIGKRRGAGDGGLPADGRAARFERP